VVQQVTTVTMERKNFVEPMKEVSITTIDSLTPSLFEALLKRKFQDSPPIQSVVAERVNQGVLSHVYRVQVKYAINDDDKDGILAGHEREKVEVIVPPSRWIVKLCRNELNLSWMFQAEKAFYESFGPRLFSSDYDVPFQIPNLLVASSSYLILEECPDTCCHDLEKGCPTAKIDFLMKALACWHALCWESPLFQNSSKNQQCLYKNDCPGMGQRMHPLQEESLFVQKWKDTLEHLELKNTIETQFANALCQKLAPLRLRDCHGKVHNERWTCVHGDFHIANWLFFPNSGNDGFSNTTNTSSYDRTKPVLVDWATFGYGNPMIDVAFFLVVSTNDEVVSDIEPWLQGYYHTLTTRNPTISVSYRTLREWFQWALLRQWMILVAYDEMCRQIGAAEPDPLKRQTQLQHFQNVNRRTILAMKSVGSWDEILSQIPKATEEERHQAKSYSNRTPLAI